MWSKVFDFVDSVIVPGKKNVFSIVGVTATGKTDLALQLAEHILQTNPRFSRVDIISADSRQIYSDIPIVSGADVPAEFVLVDASTELLIGSNQDSTTNHDFLINQDFSTNAQASFRSGSFSYPYYQNGRIFLHGVGILKATQEWSVAHFQHFAQAIMAQSWKENGCVLIVGGTGLYHAHLFNQELATQPGPSASLRQLVSDLDLVELQKKVQLAWPAKWSSMNESDRQNPRRLVRVLEQAEGDITQSTNTELELFGKLVLSGNSASKNIESECAAIDMQVLPDVYKTVYVTADLDSITKRISKRVDKRIQLGALAEIELVIAKYEGVRIPQMMTATGVKELLMVIKDQASLEQAKEKWLARERKYAKQQKTWWGSHTKAVDFELYVSDNWFN